MNNRPNNFDGFFDNDAPMMDPTRAQLAEALAHMTSKFPDWYTKPVFRMMAYSAVTKMVDFLEEAMGKGEKPDIHIAWVAFMMVVQERMISSYDKYAGEDERRLFPKSQPHDDVPQD